MQPPLIPSAADIAAIEAFVERVRAMHAADISGGVFWPLDHCMRETLRRMKIEAGIIRLETALEMQQRIVAEVNKTWTPKERKPRRATA